MQIFYVTAILFIFIQHTKKISKKIETHVTIYTCTNSRNAPNFKPCSFYIILFCGIDGITEKLFNFLLDIPKIKKQAMISLKGIAVRIYAGFSIVNIPKKDYFKFFLTFCSLLIV